MEDYGGTLERISDLGLPTGQGEFDDKRKFKFRVTFRVAVPGGDAAGETSFCYCDLVSARRCYRNILLAFYRSREIRVFAICLNHFGSGKWERPIHKDAADEGS